MPYKDREKRREYNKKYLKEYRKKNKEKIKKDNKEWYQKNKEKEKEYKKKYEEKNKEILREKRREKYLKHKDSMIEKARNYRINNKNKINARRRELWSNKNKYIVARKNMEIHNKAIKRLCNYYKIEKPYCFFCKNEYPIKHGNNKFFIVIDHKSENLSGKKDKLHDMSLYKYLCNCEESELQDYQFLCNTDNLMKESIYRIIEELKNKGDIDDHKELLDIYNNTLIIDNPKDDGKK